MVGGLAPVNAGIVDTFHRLNFVGCGCVGRVPLQAGITALAGRVEGSYMDFPAVGEPAGVELGPLRKPSKPS